MVKKSFTHVQIFMLYFVINLEVSGALFSCFNKSTEHHFEPNWLHAMTQTQLPGHWNVNIWCSNAQQGGGGGGGGEMHCWNQWMDYVHTTGFPLISIGLTPAPDFIDALQDIDCMEPSALGRGKFKTIRTSKDKGRGIHSTIDSLCRESCVQ